MAKIVSSILAISVFLPHFNANSHHYYYRIRKILRNHNWYCSQHSTYFLFLTMDCGGRERDKVGAEIGIDSSKPQLVLFATLYSIYFF